MRGRQSAVAPRQSIGHSARMLTGLHIRMGLVALGWTHQQLAEACGLGEATVTRAARADGVPRLRATNLAAIQETMEREGLQFLVDDHAGGVGVRLARSKAKRKDP